MLPETLFNYSDYKKYLNDLIDANASIKGYKSMLADSAGCQRSFMSQVLNSHVHLTPDHAVGLTNFWKLNPEQTEFFIELVHLGRAATPQLRSHLERRLKTLRLRNQDLRVRLKNPELVSVEHQSVYYSQWYWSAIHILVGVAGFHTEKSLAERLHLPIEQIRAALSVLESMELVTKGKEGWVATRKSIHAPRDSMFSWFHHSSWRTKAAEDMRNKVPDTIHYTGIHSLSREDKTKIHQMIMKMMDDTHKVIRASPEEDAVCFCIDWFDV